MIYSLIPISALLVWILYVTYLSCKKARVGADPKTSNVVLPLNPPIYIIAVHAFQKIRTVEIDDKTIKLLIVRVIVM